MRIPRFPSLSTRACASLAAGGLAGGLTTMAAVAPSPGGDSYTVPVPVVSRAVAAQVVGASIGDLREHEAAMAEAAYRLRPQAASRSALPGTFQRPAAGAVTGPFGEPRRSGAHPGLDLDGETGDPVAAAAPGTVVHSGPPPAGYSGYGTIVVIDHGEALVTLYAHLSSTAVAVGTLVTAGDVIGAIGTTGSVTGSHLHFEVRVAGVTVDPSAWLAGG